MSRKSLSPTVRCTYERTPMPGNSGSTGTCMIRACPPKPIRSRPHRASAATRGRAGGVRNDQSRKGNDVERTDPYVSRLQRAREHNGNADDVRERQARRQERHRDLPELQRSRRGVVPRRNLPYRNNAKPKLTYADADIRAAEHDAIEAMDVAYAEPSGSVRHDEAHEAYDVYEALCRRHKVCRTFGCHRRTSVIHCKNHR